MKLNEFYLTCRGDEAIAVSPKVVTEKKKFHSCKHLLEDLLAGIPY
jgi:hypothetical protein